jgi:hypothetical protein
VTLTCKSIGCHQPLTSHLDFCDHCRNQERLSGSTSDQFPETYRSVGDMAEIDAYAVFHLFQIQDPSGCLQDAGKKLLHSGSSPTRYRDVREARDILTRWLNLNQETTT